MNRRTIAYLYLLLVSVIWGAASPVVKHTLQWFDPWLFLTYRFFISTVIAIPYLSLSSTPYPKKTRDLWLLVLTGLISAPLSLFFFFEALDKTTALSGSLITAAGPLFMILGGVFFFRDRVTAFERIGITVALAGTLFAVIGPILFNGHTDSLGRLEGNAIMLCAVLLDVTGALLSKRCLKRGIHPTLIAQSQFILGFLLLLPVLFFRMQPEVFWMVLTSASPEAHFGVLFMAIISGTFAYTIRNIAVKSIEVSESALFSYLQPIWAAILAVLWLKEAITPSYIIGGVIIMTGVLIAEQKRGRQRKK